jgi:hypothetical protein
LPQSIHRIVLKNQRRAVVWYTYPQRRLQIAAAVPGSNFNRQGGSKFNRYEQMSIPIRAYVRVVAAHDHFKQWIAIPLVLIER